MNLKETYNRIAHDWFNEHKFDDWWNEGTQKFVSLLRPGASVLDVGCGAGFKTEYLSKQGLNVTGIDFSEKFIEIAKQSSPESTFHVMDMKDVVNLKKTFDAIFAQASLLHIPKSDVGNVVSILVKILNPGGYLYIAVKGIRTNGKEEDVLEENDYGYSYKRFFSYYSMKELEGYLEKENLKIVYQNEKPVGKTNWLQIIGQKV